MIFYYLAKCIYLFDRALSTVKNCADCLFEYFEILLFVRLTYEISGDKKQHFRHLLFFAFHRGQKAAKAARNRNICMVHGEGVISESTARKRFAKFKNGNFDIDNMSHSGRSSEFDKGHLKALLKEESCQTSPAEKMNSDQKTILEHLHSMGFAKNWESGCLMSLAKTTKKIAFKLLLNISPAIEQHAVTNSTFVLNRHGR